MSALWLFDSSSWETALAVPLYFALGGCGILYLTGQLSGWALLARRFRASVPYSGEKWGWQSVMFRGWLGYNNCVTVGATPEGLYLSLQVLRIIHPDLFIPWREIEVETGKGMFGRDMAQFRMGTDERVTMRVYGKLIDRIRRAAGAGWPLYYIEKAGFRAEGEGTTRV